jgi:Tfp pilus assembly protein PilN
MARWHSCNVLQVGANSRRVWQFDCNGSFKLEREQTIPPGQPLPPNLVAKSWRTLWQKKLNVAWLPPENVFLRVLQLPNADFTETLSMVEFQLEKISPLPVAQIVWSIHTLPSRNAPQPVVEGQSETQPQSQTVIVTIVERSIVEDFLGNLELEGFLADRLEVPMLDSLTTARIERDGAWVYPDPMNPGSALIAWWYSGTLQSVGLVFAPAGEKRGEILREQLTQMAWAGELEGWLTSTPKAHLVADTTTAAEWQAALVHATEQPVEVISPQNLPELASATARRAAQSDPKSNLLPQEYAVRYHQQFVDRLWMRGIGVVLGIYVVGVLIYFVALQVLSYRTDGVETKVDGIRQDYTNAIQLKQRYQILKERSELKFAALECWKTTAELLPESVSLQSLDFTDGRKLTLRGTAPSDKVNDLIDFNTAMQKATTDGQPLFVRVETLDYRKDVAGNTVSWNFTCELKHTERE